MIPEQLKEVHHRLKSGWEGIWDSSQDNIREILQQKLADFYSSTNLLDSWKSIVCQKKRDMIDVGAGIGLVLFHLVSLYEFSSTLMTSWRQLDFWRLVLGHYCADVGAYGDRGIHHCHLAKPTPHWWKERDAKHERYIKIYQGIKVELLVYHAGVSSNTCKRWRSSFAIRDFHEEFFPKPKSTLNS